MVAIQVALQPSLGEFCSPEWVEGLLQQRLVQTELLTGYRSLRSGASIEERTALQEELAGGKTFLEGHRSLAQSTASHVALSTCSQLHPLWARHLLKAVLVAERRWGARQPLLIASDVHLAQGAQHLGSLWSRLHLDPPRMPFGAQVAHLPVFAASALMNRALLEAALPLPPWITAPVRWLTFVACARGRICFLEDPLVTLDVTQLMRQRELSHIQNPGHAQALEELCRMAVELEARLGSSVKLPSPIRALANMATQGPTRRLVRLFHSGLLPTGLGRRLLFCWSALSYHAHLGGAHAD